MAAVASMTCDVSDVRDGRLVKILRLCHEKCKVLKRKMPKINIDHVVSFSSEDPVHVANNIVSGDPAKKWLCQNKGETSAVLVLQLEKASVISSIDVGNANSAYIEVLVSRSGTNDDYKVLLVMSSFMTPIEARQSTNPNKVRMFVTDQLSKPECEQKWDRIKIVCTQPFNRHVQYGLSFITFRTPDEKSSTTKPTVQTTIGKFALRPDSPDAELSTGSLFARRKQLEAPLKPAAAIREASSTADSPKIKPKINYSITPKNGTTSTSQASTSRNRNELLYKDEEEPNEKIDKVMNETKEQKKIKEAKELEEVKAKKEAKEKENRDKVSKEKEKVKEKEKKADQKEKGDGKEKKDKEKPGTSGSSSSSKRRSKDEFGTPKKKLKDDKRRKPFGELLRGVTLVISGIQNPDRADLRTKALSLGAKYKADWDDTCTHLICAFTNTPKFNQVKGKGKIVKRSWVEDCYSKRKRLPWRRFALDKGDAKKAESEDEIWEEEKRPSPIPEPVVPEPKSDDRKATDDSDSDDGGYDYIKMEQKIAELKTKAQTQDDKDTDVEDIQNGQDVEDIKNKLPEFFDDTIFFVDDTLDEDVCQMLERYVIAYKGIVTENPSKHVNIFITSEANVDNLKISFPEGLFLRPDWLWECHNSQKFVPTNEYVL